MKKVKFIAAVIAFSIFLPSCHLGRSSRKIVEHNGDFYLEIEYAGKINFTDDSTAIKSISRGGYVKFELNGKRLEAERQGEKIIYRLYDEIETSTIPDNDKQFVADAVHEMIKRGHYRN
ncbi:MAG: hypothetical protein ABUT20_11825 [Bacteroidota bacterium]